MMSPEDTIGYVLDEFHRQRTLWGDSKDLAPRDPGTWLAILTEEVGEAAKAIITPDSEPDGDLITELVQIAAVCVSWLDAIEHGGATTIPHENSLGAS